MRRQNLMLLIVGLLVLISLVFMGWAASQRTLPAAATPEPTIVDASDAPVAGAPVQQGPVNTEMFTMTLPAGWQYSQDERISQMPVDPSHVQPLVVAWQGPNAFEQSAVRFNVVAMPRNGLSLEQYLVEASERFSGTESMSNVTPQLVTDLRADGLPAALIGYAISLDAGEFTGYQAVMISPDETKLLIATLAHPADGSDVEQLLRTLVGSMHFVSANTDTSQIDNRAAATARSDRPGA